jgi:hypothetical protein
MNLTITHEMAHAWAAMNLTDADRQGYAHVWELPTWGSHDHAWADRATEKAADTISFTLMITNPDMGDNMRNYVCTYPTLTGLALPHALSTPCAANPSAAS